MYTHHFLPGDRLLVKKGIVIGDEITHSATYMGNSQIAHISPSTGLQVISIADFIEGLDFKVVHNGGIREELLWERLEIFMAQPEHHLLSNNCEHLCSFLETGKSESRQLQGGLLGFASGCMGVRQFGVKNPWVAAGLILLATYAGTKVGAPKGEVVMSPV